MWYNQLKEGPQQSLIPSTHVFVWFVPLEHKLDLLTSKKYGRKWQDVIFDIRFMKDSDFEPGYSILLLGLLSLGEISCHMVRELCEELHVARIRPVKATGVSLEADPPPFKPKMTA